MTEYIFREVHYGYTDGTALGRTLEKQEEIVRCRDCVHYKPYRTHKHGMMNRCHDEHGHTHKRDESDFCSRGERRTNDN